MSRRRVVLIAAAALLPAGCTQLPSTSSVSEGQLLLEMTEAIEGVRDENVYLQAQVDSLREAVARQDTLLARFAATNGLALPSP